MIWTDLEKRLIQKYGDLFESGDMQQICHSLEDETNDYSMIGRIILGLFIVDPSRHLYLRVYENGIAICYAEHPGFEFDKVPGDEYNETREELKVKGDDSVREIVRKFMRDPEPYPKDKLYSVFTDEQRDELINNSIVIFDGSF